MNEAEAVAQFGEWYAAYYGGRTFDVYHNDTQGIAVDCVQVDEWDNVLGLDGPVTVDSLTQQLAEWAFDHGAEYMENVVLHAQEWSR